MKIDISIIILTYNVKNLLKECIASLKSNKNIEIIVIDNGNDDTYKLFKEKNKIKYIKNKENVGFSKGNNQGLKIAKGKYILILNPDTKLEKDTLGILYTYMEKKPKVGIATCKILLPNGKLDLACKRRFPTIKNSIGKIFHMDKISKTFSGYNMNDIPDDKEAHIDVCTGAFMFIRREVLFGNKKKEGIGFFDEDFWAMGEDIDLCYRTKLAGWQIKYYPKTNTMHYKGASGGLKKSSKKFSKADINIKRRWAKAYSDSMILFYKKYYKNKHSIITNIIVYYTMKLLYIIKYISIR